MSHNSREVVGVIDRIVDRQTAVILIEEEGKQLDVSLQQLPMQATSGSWLRITLQEEEIVSLEIDTTLTKQMEARIHDKAQRLRARRKVSKFRKK
ncbi:DUF3006 domain-containing protein [Alkalicoccus saliphilus]|uniref:DUF3006 domain-containing protein n=1 Tax=Alkalicoccus saliphilus TaxID=200989 RepID=UPI001359509D|nr:DUF3006 domain-containing protein [Alkalicoccus saliphilus]